MSKNHCTHYDDCGCLTARYEARIAELEAELAEAREHAEAWESEADSANTLGQSWMAHANALRDALQDIADANGCDVEGCTNRDCLAGKAAKAALAQTPAASLAALKAEVLERAAKACVDGASGPAFDDARNLITIVHPEAERCATRIRALAAQEVKPHA